MSYYKTYRTSIQFSIWSNRIIYTWKKLVTKKHRFSFSIITCLISKDMQIWNEIGAREYKIYRMILFNEKKNCNIFENATYAILEYDLRLILLELYSKRVYTTKWIIQLSIILRPILPYMPKTSHLTFWKYYFFIDICSYKASAVDTWKINGIFESTIQCS